MDVVNLELDNRTVELSVEQKQLYDYCALSLRLAKGHDAQIFFQRLLCGFKIETIFDEIDTALKNGNSVVDMVLLVEKYVGNSPQKLQGFAPPESNPNPNLRSNLTIPRKMC